MAEKKSGNKVTKSLFETLKSKGFAVSSRAPLWEEVETLKEGESDFKLYISQTYEDSAFVVITEGDESLAIPFGKGEIECDDYADSIIDEKGLVNPEAVDFSIDVKLLSALRDALDLTARNIETGKKEPVTKDMLTLKCYVS
jgi:hypothetical protein